MTFFAFEATSLIDFTTSVDADYMDDAFDIVAERTTCNVKQDVSRESVGEVMNCWITSANQKFNADYEIDYVELVDDEEVSEEGIYVFTGNMLMTFKTIVEADTAEEAYEKLIKQPVCDFVHDEMNYWSPINLEYVDLCNIKVAYIESDDEDFDVDSAADYLEDVLG